MDALDILKSEHERVISICRQLQIEKAQRDRSVLIDKLRGELLRHFRVEEEVFYPAFKNYPDFQDVLALSFENHRNVKDKLRGFEGGAQSESDQNQVLDSLISALQKHVDTEENDFFPRVRKLMKRSERETMGRHLQAARNQPAAA